ncbi:MAG TPA: aminotransferase class I/II-fold pyridoxal phosphate-dependent enzyme [Amycolatopsis sp.]|nr:aminotransferase class I/II-fold pyridoxal phosphate-dependent enzyme [Amycolatopsis sp.]
MTGVLGARSAAARILDLERTSTRPALSPAPPGAISLAMGEPDFPTPPAIVEAAARALRDGHTHYADQNGLPALRNAIAERLPGTTPPEPEDVLVTHGATGALAAVIFAMIGPGDRVVIPEPAYSLYADLVTLAGGIVDFVPLDRSLHWDLDRLADALPGAAMVVFSNPANPTGIVHRPDELQALGDLVAGSDTVVVADEAYHRLVYPGHTFRSAREIDSLRDRVVYVQTFSKTYAMTGWRVGYLTGPPAVVRAAARVHRTMNGSMNTAVQAAALAALELPDAAVEPMLAAYRSRRELVVDELTHAPGVLLLPPEGAFYALLKYQAELPADDVARRLAQRGVLVRAGSEYGPTGDGHVRISFAAAEDDLRTGISRLRSCFADLS